MIFDLTAQKKNPIGKPYCDTAGNQVTNQIQYCNHAECKKETLQAVTITITCYGNETKQVIVTSEYVDCLECTNTSYKRLSKEEIYGAGAS